MGSFRGGGDQAEDALDDQQDADHEEEPVEHRERVDDHQNAYHDRAHDVEHRQGTLETAVEETKHRPDQEDHSEDEDRVFRDGGGEHDGENADHGFEDALHQTAVDHIENALHDQKSADRVDAPDGDAAPEDAEQDPEQDVDQRVDQGVGDPFRFFACHFKELPFTAIFDILMIHPFPRKVKSGTTRNASSRKVFDRFFSP